MATVITNDRVFLNIDIGLVHKCSVFKSIYEECDGNLFPVPNVNCKMMTTIIQFYETGEISDTEPCMLDLLLAADFLGYEELLDYGAKVVADSLKGKSASEIREYFGMTSTPAPTPVS
jgi:hypothetical protein